MPRFRKKPIVIEAEQFTQQMADTGENWPEPVYECEAPSERGLPTVFTLEGPLRVSPGDWIIRGVKGEFYPCKPDIFEDTYYEVPDFCELTD